MTNLRKTLYYVVKLLNKPADLDEYICVPGSWINFNENETNSVQVSVSIGLSKIPAIICYIHKLYQNARSRITINIDKNDKIKKNSSHTSDTDPQPSKSSFNDNNKTSVRNSSVGMSEKSHEATLPDATMEEIVQISDEEILQLPDALTIEQVSPAQCKLKHTCENSKTRDEQTMTNGDIESTKINSATGKADYLNTNNSPENAHMSRKRKTFHSQNTHNKRVSAKKLKKTSSSSKKVNKCGYDSYLDRTLQLPSYQESEKNCTQQPPHQSETITEPHPSPDPNKSQPMNVYQDTSSDILSSLKTKLNEIIFDYRRSILLTNNYTPSPGPKNSLNSRNDTYPTLFSHHNTDISKLCYSELLRLFPTRNDVAKDYLNQYYQTFQANAVDFIVDLLFKVTSIDMLERSRRSK